MTEQQPIQDQVKLPLGVAVGVVMQGIRIRFGRSVVTILGVVFGIAFLMSILTSQIIRDGVSEEDTLRTEVKRLMSFLTAETGLPDGNTYGVITCGPLNAAETRLQEHLEQQGARVVPTDASEINRNAQAILVVGDGVLPGAVKPAAGMPPLVFTRKKAAPAEAADSQVIVLEREMKPEELERAKLDARRTRSRNIWIVAASLLVTVIGISNAMLMSVTERFREIGTMKCLGALSAFIRQIFLIESGFMGLIGATMGAVAGAIFSVIMYSTAYGAGSVLAAIEVDRLLLYLAASVLAGMLLSMLAAIYPAAVAARMVPSHALRSNV